jgi:hypothetical protein
MAEEPPRVDMLGRPILDQDFDIPETPSTTGKELIPYKDPTQFNITLPGGDPNEPGEGFSAENRRRESRRWGGSPKGIGSFLRMLGGGSPAGRMAKAVLGIGTKAWNALPDEDKEKFLDFMRQPLTDKSGLEYLREWLDPEPEQEVSGELTHYPKYQPRVKKFIEDLPQDVWKDREQLQGLFQNAMEKGLISKDELYYSGGAGGTKYPSLGRFLDELPPLGKRDKPSHTYTMHDSWRDLRKKEGVDERPYDFESRQAWAHHYGGSVTKQDLLDRIESLNITEMELSDDYEGPNDPSKYLAHPPSERWTMKGGRNYKETLLNLSDVPADVPDERTRNRMTDLLHRPRGEKIANNLGWIRHHTRDIFPDKGGSEYVDRLRDQNHRPLQTTQLDEAQTDVRRLEGFPLKDKFMDIAAHRTIRQAIEDGSDYITWTSGDEQARRNDQAFYINSVNVRNEPGFVDKYGKERPWRVSGGHFNGETDQMMPQLRYADDELNEAFGKEWADKIRRDATKQNSTIWSPSTDQEIIKDLQGEPSNWLRGRLANLNQSYESIPQEVYSPGGVRKLRLYNNNDLKGKMVNIFNKIGKKFGTKVEWKRVYPSTGQVDSGDDLLRSPAVKITPELRKFYSTAPIKLAQGGLVDKPLYEDSGMRYG